MADTKAVLFVDDQQAQVFEVGVLAEQLVRAHHDVDAAVGHTLERRSDFLARAKTAHLGDLDRPFAKTVEQGLVMLLRQQRGGGQHGHLPPAGDGNKGSPQRHLGFAKTDIAADQPVHRARADHVLNHGMNGGALVGGFLKAEIIGKGFVVSRGVTKGMALASGAVGINIEQLGGGVAHLLGCFALGFVPLAAAQAVQRRLVGAHPGVAADQLQLADRHIERCLVGVLEVQKLLDVGLAVGL